MKLNFGKKQPNQEKAKKSTIREWFDALLFALIVSTIVRGLVFSAYAIPSGSMEGTELTGDYLFVSKISYGPRIAFTPIQIPFLESTLTKDSIKTYWDGIQLPYLRLPGITEIERNDVVVFNKPEEDHLPIDARTTLIKRCIAAPGDVLTLVNGKVYVNGKATASPEKSKTSFYVATDGSLISPELLKELEIEVVQQVEDNSFVVHMSPEVAKMLQTYPIIKQVMPIIEPKGKYDASIFPHNEKFGWNLDNFGPLTLPKKGMTIPLNDSTLTLYKRAIVAYEKNTLDVRGKNIIINGKRAQNYTFRLNYYWMTGDNRHNSIDSRFWGYVPEDHIIGKAIVTVFSTDKDEPVFSNIRWNRTFKSIN